MLLTGVARHRSSGEYGLVEAELRHVFIQMFSATPNTHIYVGSTPEIVGCCRTCNTFLI